MEILPIAASIMGVAMSAGHFPQAWKIWKRRSAKDVSMLTFTIFAIGDWVWLAYGISIRNWPLIVSFSVGVVGTALVLLLALKYR